MQDYLKVVVTGEVDSGKSTLIGRFLYEMNSLPQGVIEEIEAVSQRLGSNFEFAYLLDSFEEERRNQLTIDTTQVFCKNKRGNGFIFIDVPGHQELIKNMLCGSSYADIAILVADIKKSIEEGTKRHINILKFLGVEQITIILNKVDLIDFNEDVFRRAAKEIAEFSKMVGIHPGCVIPVSAREGHNIVKKSLNMPWYKGPTLIEALNTVNKLFKKKKEQDFYFPIQDIYSIDGATVYVGSIISGKIKKGESVKITSSNKEFRVKGIKLFGNTKSLAHAPEAIGLVLTEVDNPQRGQIVYKGEPPKSTNQILAKIFCVHSLSIGERLLLKCTTQQIHAKIERINRVFDVAGLDIDHPIDSLKEIAVAEVIIITEKPIAIKKFQQLEALGRFVLQDNRGICAAGIIL